VLVSSAGAVWEAAGQSGQALLEYKQWHDQAHLALTQPGHRPWILSTFAPR